MIPSASKPRNGKPLIFPKNFWKETESNTTAIISSWSDNRVYDLWSHIVRKLRIESHMKVGIQVPNLLIMYRREAINN